METVECSHKKGMGTFKAWRSKMDCTQGCNLGDHYQFVAQKSVLKRAILKEILNKRGLVSIYDYYLKLAHI